MNYYKASLQYDGTDYNGFQWQKGMSTIQSEFNHSLKNLIEGKISTVGASRTDSGVHAVEQIVKITSDQEIECSSFLIELNKTLPSQIKCLELTPCEGTFNPIGDCLTKEYRYLFTNVLKDNCTERRFIANNPYEFDVPAMKLCADAISGEHSFHNFCSTGSNVKTTIRNVILSELSLVNPHEVFPNSELFQLPEDLTECYQLRIIGNGFLKQMIRHLVSALWMVGNRKFSTEDFFVLLNGPKREKRLWKAAHPKGLCLYRINYR